MISKSWMIFLLYTMLFYQKFLSFFFFHLIHAVVMHVHMSEMVHY